MSGKSPIRTTRRHPDLAHLSPGTLPANYYLLDYHEQLYYTGTICGKSTSPAHVSSLSPIPTYEADHKHIVHVDNLKSNIKNMKNGEVKLFHETYVGIDSTSEHLRAYRAGVDVKQPLRIITHISRGVKGEKTSKINAARGICR